MSSFRPAVFATFALGVFAMPAPKRASVTTKYRIDVKADQTVDLSAFGGGSQATTSGVTAWVAVTLTDSAGGKAVRGILDSVNFTSSAPSITQATADSAKGGTIHAFLDSTRRIQNPVARPADNVLLDQALGVVSSMFPRVKSGAKLGDKWSDTTDVANTTLGRNLKTHFVLDYSVDGQETIAGMAALRLSVTSKSTMTGTAPNSQVGTLSVEGAGSGSGTSLIGADGRFLGGSTTVSLDQKLTPARSPAAIPVKVVQTVVVTLIP
ncbi:MAG: hypothetical protein HOP28_10015 [Gemmatimonadales bacterium]|nr:hypothetical protein [Gemmatimonadales bacterium]